METFIEAEYSVIMGILETIEGMDNVVDTWTHTTGSEDPDVHLD